MKSVGDLLSPTFKARYLEKKLNEYSAFPYWPEVVGAEFAEVTKPEKIIRGKIMLVRVVDAAWAQELSLHKQVFLDRLHQLNLGTHIEEIRFVTGDPNFGTKK